MNKEKGEEQRSSSICLGPPVCLFWGSQQLLLSPHLSPGLTVPPAQAWTSQDSTFLCLALLHRVATLHPACRHDLLAFAGQPECCTSPNPFLGTPTLTVRMSCLLPCMVACGSDQNHKSLPFHCPSTHALQTLNPYSTPHPLSPKEDDG